MDGFNSGHDYGSYERLDESTPGRDEEAPAAPEPELEPEPEPEPLSNSETIDWDANAMANLDDFFQRIYKYYEEKGFQTILVARVLNLLALAFTIAFSALLLLFVRWDALRDECLLQDTCDMAQVALDGHPLAGGVTWWRALVLGYLGLFSAYWVVSAAAALVDLGRAADIRHFTRHRLGLSERQLQTVTWPEVASRIVNVQRTTRLCTARDLTEHDVVSRIMRKDNYLIAMLNKGVLALNVPVPGLRKRVMLTKTLEWNLRWCILDSMFDAAFHVRPEFVHDAVALQRRFRWMAVANAVLAPFLLIFLLMFFFMRNAERFYHQPSSAGARRWSALAAWRLREFNELPHYVQHRLNASHKAAENYLAQFPSFLLSHVAKFVAFVAGSFAALFLGLALVDDALLERRLFGRNLVWWAATLGIVLAISRAFIVGGGVAFEPECALAEVVAHTHWLPRHWRGRAHTREVQDQFQQLFQFKALLFVEEVASVVLTPFVLWFSLPACAPAVARFVREFTARVDGVGDVCSLAAFDFHRHGNSKYGSPTLAPKAARSRQGKMEKSFLSFAATYPSWEPDALAKQLLASLAAGATGPTLPSPQPHGYPPPRATHLQPSPSPGADVGTGFAPWGVGALPLLAGRGGGPHPYGHHLAPLAWARAASLRRWAGGGRGVSLHNSVFGSAELTAPAASVAAASIRGVGSGGEAEDSVLMGHATLQSFYEDREQALRRGALHHTPLAAAVHAPPDMAVQLAGASPALSPRSAQSLRGAQSPHALPSASPGGGLTRGVAHPLQPDLATARGHSEPEPGAQGRGDEGDGRSPRRPGRSWQALGVRDGHQSRSDGEAGRPAARGAEGLWPTQMAQSPVPRAAAHPLADEEPAFAADLHDTAALA